MSERLQRTFVYGTFLWPRRPHEMQQPPRILGIKEILGGSRSSGSKSDFAAEILREFGSTELVGKLYEPSLTTNWTPVQWSAFAQSSWFGAYKSFKKHYLFDMQGSGVWQVLHFRDESDSTGPYVAVALKYLEEEPTWVQRVRQQLADSRTQGIS